MATDWGYKEGDGNNLDSWGMCCVYAMSNKFNTEHPELAKRLVLAHALSIQYVYKHPYNAAMIFADSFGTKPEVALNTIYMKTVKEGRTLTWQFSQTNLENYMKEYTLYESIQEEDIPNIGDFEKFMSTALMDSCGVEDFDDFIKNEIEPLYPTGMTFEDWLAKAKSIDGIESNEYDDAVNISMNK